MSTDITLFKTTMFSLSSPITSQGEGDDLLVYTISSPAPLAPPDPTPALVPVKPPITPVYSRRQNPLISSPTPTASSSDPVQNNDLPMALRSVLTQSLCLFLITICRLPLVPLLHLLILSLFLTLFMRLYLTLVDEMQALYDNGTWDLMPLPTGKNAIGCCWVFTVKFNSDGSVARLKARLVAKGYAHTYGVDYSDTFSPVAKLIFVCLFISLTASYDWDLH